LNGGFGAVFGNGPIWCFSHNCYVAGDWHAQLSSPGSQDMSRFAAIFSPRHWEKLVPDTAHAFVSVGFNGASVSRASDGSWGAAWVPKSQALTLKLTAFAASVTAKWIDPTSGATTTIAGSPFPNTGTTTVTPPATNAGGGTDWVLVVE